MGSGIAAQIRRRYPEAYHIYRKMFEENRLDLGTVSYYDVRAQVRSSSPKLLKVIANAAGQFNFGTHEVQVNYDAVRMCFENINKKMAIFSSIYDIETLNFPLFGCGLAGGDWNIVSSIIDETVDNCWTKNLYLLPG
jgi:O-acetyl-ADP-ribose deacetylase (regulator of RNase III)